MDGKQRFDVAGIPGNGNLKFWAGNFGATTRDQRRAVRLAARRPDAWINICAPSRLWVKKEVSRERPTSGGNPYLLAFVENHMVMF